MQQSKVLPLHPFALTISHDQSFKQEDFKICIHLDRSIEIVPLKSILYVAADSNYCNIFLEDGTSILHSKTLSRYQKELEGFGFLRVHQSYLINTRKAVSVNKRKGNIELINNAKIPFSNSRKSSVLHYYRSFSKIK
ncbi:MAG: LytTR family transcriptional regulator [Saprospiraceae bacterium]|nr:LytTR family transcriptional regulator [Saprospiraceae bacterium]